MMGFGASEIGWFYLVMFWVSAVRTAPLNPDAHCERRER